MPKLYRFRYKWGQHDILVESHRPPVAIYIDDQRLERLAPTRVSHGQRGVGLFRPKPDDIVRVVEQAGTALDCTAIIKALGVTWFTGRRQVLAAMREAVVAGRLRPVSWKPVRVAPIGTSDRQ